MDKLGITYIVAAKLKALPNKLKEEILESRAAVAGNELHWLKEFEHKNRRLIVSYTKNRALKDAKDRQRLIDRLMKKGQKPEKSGSRILSPELREAKKISLSIGFPGKGHWFTLDRKKNSEGNSRPKELGTGAFTGRFIPPKFRD